MKRIFLKSVVAAAVVCAFGLAQAQEKVIKAHTLNQKGHPVAAGLEKFAEIVNAKAAGKLKVNVFAGGTLGNDQASVTAVQGGTLEMHVLNTGILASQAKELAIFDFPFMFINEKEADAVVDGPVGKKLHSKLEEKGIVGVGFYELGFRQITNGRRPLNKVEDIAGLKLRVIPNPINVDWVKALDANPTPMPFPEVYAGLESKAIDGQENPINTINSNKFFEVQKHVAITNHQYNPQSVIMSKKFWDTLSADEKKIVSDAVLESAVFQRDLNRKSVAGSLDNMRKNGMQVTEFSGAEVLKFVEKMKPVIQKHAVAVGQETVNELIAELQRLRK
jgi:TRAP-type transport system periplasmic protein